MASLDTELTCAICLEIFVEPCTLTCLHSFCKACILGLIQKDSSNNSTLTCPQCRHLENLGTRGHSAIRKNFTLASIVSKYGDHTQKDTSQQPRANVDVCFTCNDEVSPADVKHASHKRTDLQSTRETVTMDIQRSILKIKENNVTEAERIKSQRNRIAEFRKKEYSAMDTIKHDFNISVHGLEQKRDNLLQDLKLYSDRICTPEEGAVQKWEEHDVKVKSTLEELQSFKLEDNFDNMKVKDLLQWRSRLNELIETAPAIRKVDSQLEFDFPSHDSHLATSTKSPITIQTCDCIPCNSKRFAHVEVCWTSDVPNYAYDVIFISMEINPEHTLKCSKINSRSILCTQLLPETLYTVTVRLHGDSKLQSEPYTFQTLPSITCSDISIHEMHRDPDSQSSRCTLTSSSIAEFTRSQCPVSNILMKEPLMYWEVRMGSRSVKRIESDHYICAAGICLVNNVDSVKNIMRNYSAYMANLGKNSDNRLAITCSKEGKTIKSIEMPRIKGKSVVVHIGMLLDLRNRTLYIVNVETNELICQFFVIKSPREDNQYVAVFELLDDADFVEIISGQQLQNLPSVLSTFL